LLLLILEIQENVVNYLVKINNIKRTNNLMKNVLFLAKIRLIINNQRRELYRDIKL